MPTPEQEVEHLAEQCNILLRENERLRVALHDVVDWAEELRYFSERGSEMAPVFQRAKDALTATEGDK